MDPFVTLVALRRRRRLPLLVAVGIGVAALAVAVALLAPLVFGLSDTLAVVCAAAGDRVPAGEVQRCADARRGQVPLILPGPATGTAPTPPR